MDISLGDLIGLSIGAATFIILFVIMIYRELQENRDNRAYFEWVEKQNNLATLIRNVHDPRILTPGEHETLEK